MFNTKGTKSGEVDMCNGPLFSKIVVFFIPVMLTNLLQTLYSAADQAVVGQFAQNGADALASIGSTNALTNLILCFLTGLSVGTSSVVARLFGAGNKDAVERAVHTSISISIILGIVLGIVGITLSKPLLILMNTQPDVLDGAVLYMQISFAGLPVVAAYNYGSAILRAVGDTKRPMIYLMIGGVVNIILNLFFVIVFNMSVDGVALATVLSQVLSCTLTLRCLTRTDGCYRFIPKKLRICKKEASSILTIGIPAGLQSSLFSFSNVLIQSSVNSLGKAAVSGSTAASNIETFVYMAMNSLYHTSLAFCGQNFGAKKLDRIMKSFLYCTAISAVVGIIMGGLVSLLSGPLLGIFIKDNPEAVIFGRQRLFVTCLPYFFCGIMEVGTGALRAVNMAIHALFNTILFTCVLRVVWCNTVFTAFPTISALFISYPTSWALTSVFNTIMFLWFFKREKRMHGMLSA